MTDFAADVLRDWLAHPGDDVRRLVLADALEEQGDPRAHLLRLSHELRSLEAREKPRPDLPLKLPPGTPCPHFPMVRGYLYGSEPACKRVDCLIHTNPRRLWPRLKAPPPSPPVNPPYPSRWSPSNPSPRCGYHSTVRLLTLACEAQFRAPVPTLADARHLLLWELYACRLVGARMRDSTIRTDSLSPADRLHKVLRAGRAGNFGWVVDALVDRRHHIIVTDYATRVPGSPCRSHLEARALLYGHFLDMLDLFNARVDWHQARTAGTLPPLLDARGRRRAA